MASYDSKCCSSTFNRLYICPGVAKEEGQEADEEEYCDLIKM